VADKQTINEYGNLQPTSWRTGDVSETYDFNKIQTLIQDDINEIKKSFGMPVSVKLGKTKFNPNYLNESRIDTQADPDGRPMPQTFWRLNG
jgi:hypothetical protein